MLRVVVGLSVVAVCLAMSYYFLVALPAHNRAVLNFERQKYADQKAEKVLVEKEQKEKEDVQRSLVAACQGAAEQKYWDYVKMNGTAVTGKIGMYRATEYVWKEARQAKADYFADCTK